MGRLLVIGAGGHGQVVAETAAACGWEQVAFLDDHSADAIGKISQFEAFCRHFGAFFVAIGDNQLRQELTNRMAQLPCPLTTLVHPTAFVSPSATIGAGTIIEPMAIVNARTRIGRGCIISVGTILDHDVVVQDFAHINAGAICPARTTLPPCAKLDAGKIA